MTSLYEFKIKVTLIRSNDYAEFGQFIIPDKDTPTQKEKIVNMVLLVT